MAADKVEATKNPVSRGMEFFSDSVEELKKVTAPTKQETIQATVVTLFIIVFVSLCLFLLDVVFNQLMKALLT